MPSAKTAYQLSDSQVSTPADVVEIFWRLVKQLRPNLGSVVDFGAGDCRFAQGGHYTDYTGVEIDPRRCAVAKPPINGRLIQQCAFKLDSGNFDACIGNPPYVRHHDIETSWKFKTLRWLAEETKTSPDHRWNLYLYFLALGCLKASTNGLVAMVVPYEWVSRPSANRLRNYIDEKGWNVSVYRFRTPIFSGVLTTASISVIDKSLSQGKWTFSEIDSSFGVHSKIGICKSKRGVLAYESRGSIWAMRGLSPGTQAVFTLTDNDRRSFGLKQSDVLPCVTTLRNTPRNLKMLTVASFRKHFIEKGERCWLIRSNQIHRSSVLQKYLDKIPPQMRQNYTCKHQKPWFNYRAHPVPQLLVSSNFTQFGPKILVNSIGAHAVGSVFGVHSKHSMPLRELQAYLVKVNFERRVVAHARALKKVEVKQMNAILNEFSDK